MSMRWWLKGVLLMAGWTAFLLLVLVVVGVIAASNPSSSGEDAERIGFVAGATICPLWFVGVGGVWALTFFLRPKPRRSARRWYEEEEDEEDRPRRRPRPS
jgi:hypothetical protein